ncbi:MAG: PEGA domain-containing protein [Acidobacteria bacterium]|nr:PEGA domain-containing protein [Acidobacteriota bacterium]
MLRCVGLLVTLFALSAAAEDGYIKASGKPGAAGLFIDGSYVGPASRFTVTEKYAVAAGEHEVTLKDPRYEDYTTKVTIQPGKTAKVKYKSCGASSRPSRPSGGCAWAGAPPSRLSRWRPATSERCTSTIASSVTWMS